MAKRSFCVRPFTSVARFAGAAFIAVTLLLACNLPAMAFNYHAIQYVWVNMYDTSVTMNTGDIALNSGDDFITKEMWRTTTQQQNEWTEFGEVVGDINEQNWNGVFMAYQGADGTYREFAIYPYPLNTPASRHEFDIARETNSPQYQDFNYDGNLVGTNVQSIGTAALMQVGMETQCNLCGYFGSYQPFGSKEFGMQWYAGGPSWTFWGSSGVQTYNDSTAANNPVGMDYNPTGATTTTGQPAPLLTFY